MTLCPSRPALWDRALPVGAAAHSCLAGLRVDGRWPGRCACAPRQRRRRYVGSGSGDPGGLPDERGQLARAGDGGDVGGLSALDRELCRLAVKAMRGAPGHLDHARILARLTGSQLIRGPRSAPAVLGGFDQQPPRVLGAGLGDRALATLLVGGPLGRDQAEEGGELAGMAEVLEVADLGAEPGRGQRVDAPKAAQTPDRLRPSRRRWPPKRDPRTRGGAASGDGGSSSYCPAPRSERRGGARSPRGADRLG